ncbi:MAG: alpha/beta fold hydrolase [Alphaproteobacteria bacterium]|nr:alpha/beta fold hydrolase [Alphaproteobacteria bacterium]
MADFIRIPTNPVPERAELFDFKGAGGRLRAATFLAEKPRGGVVLMAGRVEFMEKYFEVVRDLQARGLSVATMDWRGQGRSERLLADPMKGHIDSFATFKNDLLRFTEDVARKRFSGPLFLLTHSMGGLPALELLADGYDAYSAAVLSAPMTRLFASPAMRAYAWTVSSVASALGARGRRVLGVKEHSLKFEGNVLTSDPARYARFLALQQAAPDALIREPTFGWLKAACEASADLRRPHRFDRLKTPILIVSAGKEALIDASDHAFIAAQSPLIKHLVLKDSLHEILMERDVIRNEFWKAFDDFTGRFLV